jgi:phosphoserine phosphatase
MQGRLPFRQAMEMRFAALRPLPYEDFTVHARKIVLRPGARELVARLKQEGIKVAIASGGFDFLVGRIASELGVELYAANQPKVHNGHVIGFAEPLVDEEGKRRFVQRLQGELGFAREETAVVADGANDLAMMGEAGLSIAFAAKKAVRERADIAVEGGDWDGLIMHLLEHRGRTHARRVRALGCQKGGGT